jgi:hypothetical protein
MTPAGGGRRINFLGLEDRCRLGSLTLSKVIVENDEATAG